MIRDAIWATILIGVGGAYGWAGDRPAFRGPTGNGVAVNERPPVEWSPDKNIRWKIALPGTGNGSPIVVQGRVLLTCAQDLGRQRILYCFDRSDGRLMWAQATAVDQVELTHIRNPYCGTTPVSDGKVVVVWHGTGGLHGYSLDGKPLWRRDFGEIRHLWGYGTSPIIYRDRVILHSGACPRIFMAAVELGGGELLWRTEEPGGQSNETPDGDLTGSWCTPIVVEVDGEPQIVCGMPTAVVAYDPATGRTIWRCEGLAGEDGKLVYASPMAGTNRIVVMGGYQGPALAVRPGGGGNVTATHRLWHVSGRLPQRIGSGVMIEDSIFIANADGGTIQCLDAKTGAQRYRERVRGGPHWSSTILANGLLYATNTAGMTRVFRPNPRSFELVAVNALHETVYATPAFSDNEIFIRTAENLYCIAR